ncbi:F-box protein PP2-B11-like [Bidens hawaiensis]|uniref:F-box protein PP2-B11-like n=1 Tax=Bidens hawaiensis TaxID=980011 RepID=UPI004048FCF7
MRSRRLNMDHEHGFVDDFFGSIPEGFVSKAVSLTSPRDACRLSSVCSIFRSAAAWDDVWESFLPSDYPKIVTVEDGGCSSKKQLFLRLCDHPIVIDGGNKIFFLDKHTGKKCYMLAARDLSIVWGDTPRYWRWISLPESRFAEVAELISVCWLEVHGRICTSMLSPNTVYVAFMVFKSTSETHGFDSQPAEVSVGLSGLEGQTHTVFLEPEGGEATIRRYPVVPRTRMGMFHRVREANPNLRPSPNRSPVPVLVVGSSNGKVPKQRKDGWMEIELGEYFVKEGEEGGELVMSMKEVKGRNWKGGIVIQGIEIRPKPTFIT